MSGEASIARRRGGKVPWVAAKEAAWQSDKDSPSDFGQHAWQVEISEKKKHEMNPQEMQKYEIECHFGVTSWMGEQEKHPLN